MNNSSFKPNIFYFIVIAIFCLSLLVTIALSFNINSKSKTSLENKKTIDVVNNLTYKKHFNNILVQLDEYITKGFSPYYYTHNSSEILVKNKNNIKNIIEKGDVLVNKLSKDNVDLDNQWIKVKKNYLGLLKNEKTLQTLSLSFNNVHRQLFNLLQKETPFWKQLTKNSEVSKSQLINFSLALSQSQFLYNLSNYWNSSNKELIVIPDNFFSSYSNINNSLKTINSSQLNNTPLLTNALGVFVSGLSKINKDIAVIKNNANTWNNNIKSLENIRTMLNNLHKLTYVQNGSLKDIINNKADNYSSNNFLIVAEIIMLFSFLYLLFDSIKIMRRKDKFYENKINYMEDSIDIINDNLDISISGDNIELINLDTKHKGLSILNTKVQDFTKLYQDKRGTFNQYKEEKETKIDILSKQNADLLNNLNNMSEYLLNYGNKLLETNKNYENSKKLIDSNKSLNTSTINSQYKENFEKFQSDLNVINERVEDSLSFIEKTSNLLNDFKNTFSYMFDMSEQISVLSIQANLQISKEEIDKSNFKLIADNLKFLSDKFNKEMVRSKENIKFIYDNFSSIESNVKQTNTNVLKCKEYLDVNNEIQKSTDLYMEKILHIFYEIDKFLMNEKTKNMDMIEKNENKLFKIEKIIKESEENSDISI